MIQTERLLLRRLVMADAAAIGAYRGDPEVARYQSWDSYGLEDAVAMCEEQSGVEFGKVRSWFQMTVVREGEVIGDCGLHFVEAEKMEIGITLSRAWQGKGLALEVVGGVLELAFGMGMREVIARTDVRNGKAAALFEKAGFRRTGPFLQCAWYKGEWCDEFEFVIQRGGARAGR